MSRGRRWVDAVYWFRNGMKLRGKKSSTAVAKIRVVILAIDLDLMVDKRPSHPLIINGPLIWYVLMRWILKTLSGEKQIEDWTF